jgi:septal ring factor EnvC (AmiA/AmiB activator)
MKMNMLRRCTALAGVVVLSMATLNAMPAMAQGGGGGGRMMMSPDQQVAAIDKAVTLTDDQKPKVLAIVQDSQKKMADLRNSGEDFQTLRPKMMEIRQDQNDKIKALLTDDQKTKYDAYIASMRRGGPGGMGGPPAGGPPPSGSTTPPPQTQQ